MDDKILNMPIERLNLNTRAHSNLIRAGYNTVGKLVEATTEELLMTGGLGKKSVDEIVQKLDALGLSLKPTVASQRRKNREPDIKVYEVVPINDHFDNEVEEKNVSIEYKDMKVEKWVGVEELVEYLSITKRTIHAWIQNGKIPGYKVGRFYRFKLSEVDEWIRSGRARED